MGSKTELPPPGHPLVAYGYMVLWVTLSATVIMFNKYILAPDLGGFPYPLTLTSVHMVFCSAVSWVLVKLRLVEVQDMPLETYTRCVVPIGMLFAVTLWMGNAAYLYLSVSFIQMIKALMPMLVYSVAVALGIEQWSKHTGSILAVVVGGVLLASYGEVVFVLLGVLFQGASLLSEAVRLTLVQLLLQHRGFKLNPVSTMYHISPVCFMALLIPLATLEAEEVLTHPRKIGLGMLLCSAAAAFALNIAVFLVIGKTSALTMNVAGVVKDVLLVCLSVAVYGSHVSLTQVLGYIIALSGVCAYNYSKIHKAQQLTWQAASCTLNVRTAASMHKAQQGASKPPGQPAAHPDFPGVRSHRVSVSSTASDDSSQWDAAVAVDESARPLLGTVKAGESRSMQPGSHDDGGCALRLSPKVGGRGQLQNSGTPKFWPRGMGAGDRSV